MGCISEDGENRRAKSYPPPTVKKLERAKPGEKENRNIVLAKNNKYRRSQMGFRSFYGHQKLG